MNYIDEDRPNVSRGIIKQATLSAFEQQVRKKVDKCHVEIAKAAAAGHFDCYCSAGKLSIQKELMSSLAKVGIVAELCSVKGVVIWENDRDPYGETLKRTKTKEVVYVNWSGRYKTGYVQSLWNHIFYREKVRVTLDWNKDEFRLLDHLNSRKN